MDAAAKRTKIAELRQRAANGRRLAQYADSSAAYNVELAAANALDQQADRLAAELAAEKVEELENHG